MSENRSPQHQHPVNLVGPIFLIGLGTLLLLNNTGYLEWNFLDLIRLWPLLIIATGLEILIGKRSVLGSFITALVILGMFIGGIWLLGTHPGGEARGEVLQISEARNDITKASIVLSPAVARLRVDALNDSGNFVEGTVYPRQRERIGQSFSSGNQPRFVLETESDQAAVNIGPGDTRVWELGFHSEVALDMNVDIGVGEVDLDMSDLTIDEANVDFGIGQAIITLPGEGKFNMVVDGGIGLVTIKVPPGMAVRIKTDTGIAGRTIPRDYAHHNGVYTSPDYDKAENRADITLGLGIGNVVVKEARGD